jgi:hypothetical protein
MVKSVVLIALGCSTLAAVPAAAALAPNYQRLAELRMVLDNPGVADAFGPGDPIDRIQYVRPDLYRVVAGRCHLDVAIIGLPMPGGMVGARRFEARPGRKSCG